MNTAKDVVEQAKKELKEIDGRCGNNNKYTHWYSDNVVNIGYNFYWCAAFVSYVCRTAGVPTNVVPNFAACSECMKFARSKSRLHSKSEVKNGSYKPKAGDIMFRGEGEHTGIVVSVSDSSFSTIEGNTGGTTGCRTVTKKSYNHNAKGWDYLFEPAYDMALRTSYIDVQPQRRSVIKLPAGMGKYYSYERWNRSDWLYKQKELVDVAENNGVRRYDADGFGMIGNRYVVAVTSTFGLVGDYIDIYCADGRIINAIIGDIKNQNDKGCNKWGHNNGQVVVEWMTNWQAPHANPKGNGGVTEIINLGNYFDYPEYLSQCEEYSYNDNAEADNEKTAIVWNRRIHEPIAPNLESVVQAGILSVNGHDVYKYAGGLTFSDGLDTLAMTLDFHVAKTDMKYMNLYVPKEGDPVTYKDTYKGVIVSVEVSEHSISCKAVDLGFYLKNTKQTYQFKNITVKQAIKILCEDLSIEVKFSGEFAEKIENKIYVTAPVSDIINELLELTAARCGWRIEVGVMHVFEISKMRTNMKFRLSDNTHELNSLEYTSDIIKSASFETMKNSVKIIGETDDAYHEMTVKQSRDDINKFGFLQEIVSINAEKEDPRQVAEKKLAELNKITHSYSFTAVQNLGFVRSGDVLSFSDGDFVVTSTTQTFVNGFRRINAEVERL